eukprot:4844808-Pleurochrysis_carterae.AAC.1
MINIADTTLKNRLRRDYTTTTRTVLGRTSSTCTRSRTMTPASPRLLTSARLWLRRAWRPAPRLRRAP